MPIRMRVAAAFAVAMTIVLAATGAFVYARLSSNLAERLDENLRLRIDDVSALVERSGGALADDSPTLIERGESFAQLLNSEGTVLDASAGLSATSLLNAEELALALNDRTLFLNRPAAPILDEPVRLLAVPVALEGGEGVLVVGATRENNAEALADLRNSLLVAGPIALLLATGLGYRLAGAGLGVVETMRQRASEISATTLGGRLPVPETGDELERLGRTLNDMLDRLEQALERERTFVADASHELRTPLALLRAELDVALQPGRDVSDLQTALRRASEETDRLVQLTGDLLLLARTDQGRLSLRREQLTAESLFASVRNRFLLRAQESGREIALNDAGVQLEGDRVRLEQALGNLVDNALRHGLGVVRLDAQVDGDQVALSVSDQGPGFPENYLEHAFERFSRPDEGRGGAGTGLGLAIVKGIAEAHGGSVAARAGRGAAVTLLLPVTVRS